VSPSAGSKVEAAGAVPWRPLHDDGIEVAVVHRGRYDDWSFPKGHLEAGESSEQAARREVLEEAGLLGPLGVELRPSRYEDRHGRPKVVRWWAMEVTGGEFVPNDEVDELRWLAPTEAYQLLTYADDRALLGELLGAFEP
jgi:8-oxo-dGTP diphosphatase